MTQSTRQRIIGAVFILALALVFLPMLFDGEGSYEVTLTSRIPPAPVVEPLTLPAHSRPRPVAPASPATESPRDDSESGRDGAVPAIAASPAAVDTVPELNAAGLPDGWVVRLATFAVATNAAKLIERLKQAGHRAYIRRLDDFHVVFVGPWVDRGRAEENLALVESEFDIADAELERYVLQGP